MYECSSEHMTCCFFVVCASCVYVVGVGFVKWFVAVTSSVVIVCVVASSGLALYCAVDCTSGIVCRVVSVVAGVLCVGVSLSTLSLLTSMRGVSRVTGTCCVAVCILLGGFEYDVWAWHSVCVYLVVCVSSVMVYLWNCTDFCVNAVVGVWAGVCSSCLTCCPKECASDILTVFFIGVVGTVCSGRCVCDSMIGVVIVFGV